MPSVLNSAQSSCKMDSLLHSEAGISILLNISMLLSSRDLLGVIRALGSWRCYLEGGKLFVVVPITV